MRFARAVPLAFLVSALAAPALAGPADRDAHMDQYLAIWSRDGAITPATIGRLYAGQVVYYGRPMSAAAVYRDKLAFIRTWPRRSYEAVPGTVTNDCRDGAARCRVTALMRWSRADAAGLKRQSGVNSVRLDLARQDGTLRIVRESGSPVGRR